MQVGYTPHSIIQSPDKQDIAGFNFCNPIGCVVLCLNRETFAGTVEFNIMILVAFLRNWATLLDVISPGAAYQALPADGLCAGHQ